MKPADELRAAVAKLRAAAEHATPGPWRRAADVEPDAALTYGANHIGNWCGSYLDSVATAGSGEQAERDAAWITLVHPGLAEPLAAWLEAAAAEYWDDDWTDCPTAARAVAVARVILGEAADA